MLKRSGIVEYANVITVHMLNHILMFSLPILILYMRDDLGLSYTQSGQLWTVLIVTMTVLSIFAGIFADTYNHRRYQIVYLGTALMVLVWFFLPFTTTLNQFFILFFVFGVGASAFHPPSFAIITELFEGNKAKALSFNMVSGMITTAIAPVIFSSLIDYFHLFNDWQGATLFLASIFAGIFIISISYIYISGHLFIKAEDHANYNLDRVKGLDIKFLFAPTIVFVLLFISIRSSFFRTASLFTSLLYEDYLSLSKFEASIATAFVLGFSSMFTVVGGYYSDRTKPYFILGISAVGTFIAAGALIFISDFTDLISFSVFYFLLLAMYYFGSPAASALLADRVGKAQRGKVFGALFSIGQMLGMFTPIIFGWIKDNQGINAAFFFIFILAFVALLVGIVIVFRERKFDIQRLSLPNNM